MNAREHTLADFARIQPTLPAAGVPWLARARNVALERFAASGYPDTHAEDWKYTSVAAIEKQAFRAVAQRAHDDKVGARVDEFRLRPGANHFLVFIDGRHCPEWSAPGRLPAGATLGSLAAQLGKAPDSLEPFLASSEEQQTVFGALNTAFMTDGAYLRLARGTVVEQPIHLLFLATQAGAAGAAISLRNLIVAEEGAQATVIEHYAGADAAVYLTNALTQICAAANAKVTHYKLQQEGEQAFHVAGIHAQQARDSQLISHSITLGAALTRNDISTAFAATGCEAALDGLYLVGGRQHVDNHTRIDHLQPRGTSRESYRGILDGRARAVFNGKVIVHPGAQKTNAQQANHNLLLSPGAEVDSKPQLEIYADDVKCTHAATIGQLDENQLFYLRARGIEEALARSLLVHAFAHDVIERIGVAALRTRLENILFSRLPYGERIRELA